jgi:hypothetical protein
VTRPLIAAVTAAVAALTLSAPSLALGPYETFGVDARSKGMGNARTAASGDWAASHYNPAGLARVERFHLELSTTLSLPAVDITLADPNVPDELTPRLPSPVTGTTIGLAFPLGGFLKDWAYAGAAVHVPLLVLTHAAAPDPATPFVYLYDSYTERIALTAALAIKPFDWFAAGAGIRIGAGQSGDVQLAIDPLLRRITLQEIDAVQFPRVAPTAGVTLGGFGVDGVIEVKGGLAWRAEAITTVDINSVMTIDGLDLELALPLLIVSNYTPETIVVGTSFEIVDRFEFAADLAWLLWSRAPTPFLQGQVLIGGDGAEDLGLNGDLDTPGPGEDRAIDVGFSDTLNVRAGVAYQLAGEDAVVRAGYAWRPTPVPDQTTGTNIVDNNAHILSLGGGVRARMPWIAEQPVRLDFSWQTQLLQARSATKRGADPVGDWTARGAVHEVSMGVGLQF